MGKSSLNNGIKRKVGSDGADDSKALKRCKTVCLLFLDPVFKKKKKNILGVFVNFCFSEVYGLIMTGVQKKMTHLIFFMFCNLFMFLCIFWCYVQGNSGGGGEVKTCHQCKRHDKGPVVKCSMCAKKGYCFVCISELYVFSLRVPKL